MKEAFLIFDLDGTLLDTLDDLWASVNYALAQFSLPLRSKCEIRSFLGNGARYLVQQATGSSQDKVVDSVYEVFRHHYFQHSHEHTRPYPGILDMLRECRRRGYRTAIVSNKPDTAVQELHHCFFEGLIDVALGQQADLRRKPAPDMVFAAIQKLPPFGGAERNQRGACFYIGDSEVDIATARAASLPCICVDWGFRDRHFLEEQGATHIIHLPEELFALL